MFEVQYHNLFIYSQQNQVMQLHNISCIPRHKCQIEANFKFFISLCSNYQFGFLFMTELNFKKTLVSNLYQNKLDSIF